MRVPEIHPLAAPVLRRRALWQMVPDPAIVAWALLAGAGLVSGEAWLTGLAVLAAFYNLAHLYGSVRWDVCCEPVDHWHGDGEPPAELADECEYCADVPPLVMWRATRRAGRKDGR